MPRKPSYQRKNKAGRIVEWPADADPPDVVASSVRYAGHRKHKTYSSPAGPGAHRADDYKCDRYDSEQWPRLVEALRDAIRARYVGEFRGRFPSRAWAWINGVLHEARQNGWDSSDYHGFPLDDPRHYPAPASQLENAPRVEIPSHRV